MATSLLDYFIFCIQTLGIVLEQSFLSGENWITGMKREEGEN
jgi:hypothetical protein